MIVGDHGWVFHPPSDDPYQSLQSLAWNVASRPASSGERTCSSKRGHHPAKHSHETKSSISMIGAAISEDSCRARKLLPDPLGPSTPTIRIPLTGFRRPTKAAISAATSLIWESLPQGHQRNSI